MTFDKAAKKKLMSYNYPGNVRELKAIVELAAVMADDNIISGKTKTGKKKTYSLGDEIKITITKVMYKNNNYDCIGSL